MRLAFLILLIFLLPAPSAFSSTALCSAGASFSFISINSTYDGHGNPLKMVSPAHQGTSIVDSTNAYDPNTGNLTETLDAKGNPTYFNYQSGTSYLTGTMDAAGHTTSMAYDNSGNMTGLTDSAGVTTSLTYDANGNKSSQSVPVTLSSGPTTLTTQYQYDDNGNLTKTIAPDGSSTQTVYNDLGKVDHTIDAGGRTTQYTYDDLGQLITSTFPDTSTTQTIYDANGNTIATKDQMGRWTGTQYDALGRTVHAGPLNTTTPVTISGSTITYNWLTDTTTSLPIYTTTVYNDDGTVKQQTDEDGHTTSYTYDGYGRKLTETDGFGVTTATYSYDANGNQQTVTTPAPVGSNTAGGTVTTQYQYDEDSRLVKTIYPDNSFTQTDYNSIGQKIDTVDQDGRMTQFDYDPDGHLWHVTNPIASEVTTFGYDEIGDKIWQQDANDHTTHFAYDDAGRLIGKTLPDGSRSMSLSYNQDGSINTITDYNGYTTTYGYDGSGRLTSKTPDSRLSQPSVTYSYYADGQKHVASRGGVSETFSYDATRGWLTSILEQNGSLSNTLQYGYDDAGNRTGVQTASGTTTYGYDADNRLHTVLAPGASTPTVITYDQIGNRAGVSRPNGITTAYAYDQLGRLTGISHSINGAALAFFNYQLDAAGQRMGMTTGGTGLPSGYAGVTSYGYDGDGRLTSEVGPGVNNSYIYDKVGNRTSQTIGGTTTAFTYDADDRNSAYTYDNNGNVTSMNGATLAYDFENHLINAGNESFAYDADGNRVTVDNNGTITNDVIDPTDPYVETVEERDSANNLLTRYDYAGDTGPLDILPAAGGSYFPLVDGLDSTRLLTNGSGSVTDAYNYDAYGDVVGHSGSAGDPYLFNGEVQDADGLYFLRARYYAPVTGTMLSQDPFEGHPQDPISLHRYLYASDDPLNQIDPSGMEGYALAGTLATLAVAAILVAGCVYGRDAEYYADAHIDGLAGERLQAGDPYWNRYMEAMSQIRYLDPDAFEEISQTCADGDLCVSSLGGGNEGLTYSAPYDSPWFPGSLGRIYVTRSLFDGDDSFQNVTNLASVMVHESQHKEDGSADEHHPYFRQVGYLRHVWDEPSTTINQREGIESIMDDFDFDQYPFIGNSGTVSSPRSYVNLWFFVNDSQGYHMQDVHDRSSVLEPSFPGG